MTPADTVWAVSQLRDLVTGVDPVYSVYLGIQPTDAAIDFADDLIKRWHAHATVLAEQGADPGTRDAVTGYLNWLQPQPNELAVFGVGAGVPLAGPLPGEPPFDLVRWGAPASVVPVLGWLQRHPAYVVVLVDRTGADVTAVPAGATEGVSETILGPDDQIKRVKAGGWSASRFQRRVDDSGHHNAGAAAEAVVAAAERVGARLLLVGGDVNAARLLAEQLPPALLREAPVRPVPGSRSPDRSEPVRHQAIMEALAEHAKATNRERLERFTANGARDGVAVAGAEHTLAALLEGRVETLFVPEEPNDDRTAWFGPDLLCVARPELAPPGSDAGLRPGRLVDVAVRAALLTDADVRVLDPADAEWIPDRISALCRFR